MVEKKRKSKRLSTRKQNKILKKIRKQNKDRRKEERKKRRSRDRVPRHVLMDEKEIEQLKQIKENEKMRAKHFKEKIEQELDKNIEDFKKLVERNDVLLEILDARDPVGTRLKDQEDFIKKNGKDLFIVLNFKCDMPEEKVFEWKNSFSEKNKVIVIFENNKSSSGILNFIEEYQNKNVGIFGSPKVGKNFVFRLLSKEHSTLAVNELRVDDDVVKILVSKPSIFSILRNVHNLSDVLYEDIFKKFLNTINKEDFCMHFAVPNFENYDELVVLLSERYKIQGKSKSATSRLVFEVILKDFFKKKILFWRNNEDDSSICLWYK